MTAHPGDVIAQHPTAIEAALAVADADLRDRHGPDNAVEPWYLAPGGPTDHIYRECPGLRRSLRGGEPRQGSGALYPDAGDVCGLCVRWWKARKRRKAMPDQKTGTMTVDLWYRVQGKERAHLFANCPTLRTPGTPVETLTSTLRPDDDNSCRRCLHRWRLQTDSAYARDSLKQRLLSRREVRNGCWEWQGTRKPDGYGAITLDRRPHYVHRVSWEVFNGPIPDGKWILHHCDNPPCFNPAHLFLGDVGLNNQDAVEKRRDGGTGRANRDKTHCANGHLFTPENTYVAPRGGRECRECSRRAKRAYNARKNKEQADGR